MESSYDVCYAYPCGIKNQYEFLPEKENIDRVLAKIERNLNYMDKIPEQVTITDSGNNMIALGKHIMSNKDNNITIEWFNPETGYPLHSQYRPLSC